MSFDWEFFWKQLLSPQPAYLGALWLTLFMAVVAQVLGTLIGAIVAGGRLSSWRLAQRLSFAYIWFGRGIPIIVLMVLLYTGIAAVGIFRFEDFVFLGVRIPDNVQAAIVALALREGAYMAEVIRNGIQAVEQDQINAARALGMPWWLTMRRIVIPQAMRVIIPPLGNNFNIMLKTVSLASVIGVQELFLQTRTISAATFRVFEMFLVLSINFLLLTTLWAIIQAWIESRLRKHEAEYEEKSWWRRITEFLGGEAEGTTSRGIA